MYYVKADAWAQYNVRVRDNMFTKHMFNQIKASNHPWTHVDPHESTGDLNRPYLVREPKISKVAEQKLLRMVELGGVVAISTQFAKNGKSVDPRGLMVSP